MVAVDGVAAKCPARNAPSLPIILFAQNDSRSHNHTVAALSLCRGSSFHLVPTAPRVQATAIVHSA